MKYKKTLLFAITAFLFFSVSSQQRQGIITGTVKDAKTKFPITDAVITVSSNVFNGQKLAVTDSGGRYKIINLPEGKYRLSFEMEGYKKFVQDSINMVDGMSLAVDTEMEKERK